MNNMTKDDIIRYYSGLALQGMLSSRSIDWDIGDDKLYTAMQAQEYGEAMYKAELIFKEQRYDCEK